MAQHGWSLSPIKQPSLDITVQVALHSSAGLNTSISFALLPRNVIKTCPFFFASLNSALILFPVRVSFFFFHLLALLDGSTALLIRRNQFTLLLSTNNHYYSFMWLDFVLVYFISRFLKFQKLEKSKNSNEYPGNRSDDHVRQSRRSDHQTKR